jgi:predicted negative regulator of RcsB-dependent stress response
MKKDPMPFWMAIALLVVGILLGSVFSFGMQYWNKEVTREECVKIQT